MTRAADWPPVVALQSLSRVPLRHHLLFAVRLVRAPQNAANNTAASGSLFSYSADLWLMSGSRRVNLFGSGSNNRCYFPHLVTLKEILSNIFV